MEDRKAKSLSPGRDELQVRGEWEVTRKQKQIDGVAKIEKALPEQGQGLGRKA